MKSLLGTGFSRLKRHLSGKEGPDETGGRLFDVPLSSATETHCRLETPQENQKQSREGIRLSACTHCNSGTLRSCGLVLAVTGVTLSQD